MKNNINYQKIQDVWASFGVLQVHFLSYITIIQIPNCTLITRP